MSVPILSIRDGQISFADKLIFTNLNLHVYPYDRVCLVGKNGAGKSTLFKSLMQLIDLDHGEYYEKPQLQVAYLPQDIYPPEGMTAIEYVEEQLLKTAPAGTTTMQHVAEKALSHFNVEAELLLSKASGGEKRRVGLASVLMQDVDLLLLDEPTNHLDVDLIQQLEEDMKNFRGAVVVVSHDRTFLENVSTKTWWLNRKTLSEMRKGYKYFETWQEETIADELKRLEKLDTKLAQEARWLHRGVTARRKRNQGRLQRLHEMRNTRSTVLKSVSQKSIQMESPEIKQLSGKLVIEAEDITKRYGDRTILEPFSTKILRGDRIGVFGPNGSGKSTLIKMLIGELPPTSGRLRIGTKLSVGYFEQQHHNLDPNKTLWEVLCPNGGDHLMVQGRYKHVVAYLKDFLFDHEQAKSCVGTLSGGERNRLALAKIFAEQHNCLVLDEPTNDLDMDTLDLLIDMLSEYDGTLLVVSHDRDFLDKVVTSTISIERSGEAVEYAGGYTDFIAQKNALAPKIKKTKTSPKKVVAEKPKQEPKKFGFKEQHRLKELDKLIPKVEEELDILSRKLQDPTFAGENYEAFLEATKRFEALQEEREKMETEWIELEMKRDDAT